MLKAIRHVRGGGALFVFPAGEVSTAPSTMGRAVDREWPEQIAQLVVGSKAQVVPFFFDDQNGPLFQWVSRYLGARASLFPRQTMRRAGTQMTLRIGRALQPGVRPAAKDNGPRHYFNSNEELIRFLQTLAYLHDQHFDDPEKIYDNRRWSSVRAVRQLFRNLRRRDAPSGLIERKMADIVSAVPARVLEESVAAVLAADPSSLLVDNRELQVFLIRRNAMTEPIIREIGRQREETFRLVGEGSGKSIDLDEYDDTYLHMFIWHKVDRQIAGAYRLGVVDELIGAKQLAGLYTHLFFDYDSRFIDRIGNAVELGRSYVYHPYQISRTGLLIFNSLWEAIARFLARNPNIDSLFGPVSISGDYSTYSKLLVTQFLERHHGGDAETKALIAPRVPFERRPGTAVDHRLNEFVDTLVDIFSPTVDAADNDGLLGLDFVVKSIDDKAPLPPLVKHYTKLGAKYFAFSVDHDFHTVDGLIVVDVDRIPKRTLERYLGDEAAVAYQQRRINFRNASPR
jgi:putative hemolysin